MVDLEGAGATLFLCRGDSPGIVIDRTMDTMDRNYVEGHCVVRFDDLHLPASALLGEEGRHESSMTKAMVSEELFKVADRCVQVLGGMGISDETPVAGFFRDVRAFRLYDGPTEVHQHAIASRLLRD